MIRLSCISLVLAALALCWPGAADAQSCTVSMGNINFGTVNNVGQGAATTSGTMNVNCNSAGTPYVRVCIALGAPVDMSWDPRLLAGPGGQRLDYNIYSDPSHTQIWGSAFGTAGEQVGVNVPIAFGSGSRSVNYYAKVPVQNDARAGNYSAAFAMNTDAAVRVIGYNSTPPACGTQPVNSYFAFNVYATVASDCAISASTLDFGPTGLNLATAAVDAAGTITATCTLGANYSLSLNVGQGSGATMAQRRLTRSGGPGTLIYGLYRNAARNLLWGDGSAGSGTQAGTGGGVNVANTHTVYGRLPAQTVPPAGSYSDTITVTVTY